MKTIKMTNFLKKRGYQPYVDIQKKHAYAAVYDALLKSKTQVIKETPVDTGLMASSWEIQKKDEDTLLFGNTAPYAFEVEYGRPPGKISDEEFNSLRDWVARKLIGTRPIDRESREVTSTTYAIAKTIEKQGIQPTFILQRSMKKVIIPLIEKNLEKAEKIKDTEDEFIQKF